MPTTKTFKSGNSEAVRLPREMAFGLGVELSIERTGDVVTLRPRSSRPLGSPSWRQDLHAMLNALEAMPKPSAVQARDEIELPERNGL